MNPQKSAPNRESVGLLLAVWWHVHMIVLVPCALLCVPLAAHAAGEVSAKTAKVSAKTTSSDPSQRPETGQKGSSETSASEIEERTGETTTPPAVVFGPERPWETGVTPERQQAARQLLGEGNRLWSAARFSEAADKFAQALRHWDHPRIHYNLALALIALSRSLEVHQHLRDSMRYGRDALTAEQREWAGFHLRDLETQRLSAIDVRCEIPGAEVSIDGRLVFTAPGWHHVWVLPGPHTISTSKPGYIGTNHTENLKPGLAWVTQARVYTKTELTRSSRRWPSLVTEHLVLAGAGAALLAVGGALTLGANAAIGDINERCKGFDQCDKPSELDGLESRALEMRQLAAFSYVAGGSAFVTGLVLTLLNLKKTNVIDPPEEAPRFVRISPLVSGQAVGVSGSGKF